MKPSQALFLARYYASNLINSKIRGRFVVKYVEENSDKWTEIRNKNSGHDAWLVVGNGPSLKIEDLESLGHLPAVASNKINLLYGQTDWRPTLYTVSDPLLLFKLPEEHYNDFPQAFMSHTVFHLAKAKRKLPWKLIQLPEGERLVEESPFMPDPVNPGLIDGRTVTVTNIQLAMWCGAKTVYIIGCDHNYKEEKHENVAKLEHQDQANHFHKNYRKPGEIVNSASTDYMNRGYRLMRQIAENNGIRIINITRKTALEAFEKGTVEEAVSSTR